MSVSRDTLRAELAEMELRLVAKLATKAEVDSLSGRVAVIEAHGSPQAQELAQKVTRAETKLELMMNWRARMMGAVAVITFILSAAVSVVAVAVFHP